MANRLTGAQRYNNRMDKIWETARKNGALDEKPNKINSEIKTREWTCELGSSGAGEAIECTRARDTFSTMMFNDGSIRATKFEDSPIKINGKKIKTLTEKRGLYPSIDIY